MAAFFALFVLFLYGPMLTIFTLSFQGPTGGLVFPIRDPSFHWFAALFGQARTGDVWGSFGRSFPLALIVLCVTVVFSVLAGLGFRRRFAGATPIFYMAVASLIVPGLILSIGIGLGFQFAGIPPRWYSSALGAQLTWTLPFGLLIMFAVFSRFSRAYEEAARGLGATPLQTLRNVVLPIVLVGLIAVALFGFTLSYDEFPAQLAHRRSLQHAADRGLGHDDERHLAGALCLGHGHDRGLVCRDCRRLGIGRDHPAPPSRQGAIDPRRLGAGIATRQDRTESTSESWPSRAT